jgi:hypothetical protein
VTDEMYAPSGRLLGKIRDDRSVEDADGTVVGRVHRAGGGDVFDAADWMAGEAFGNGVVEDVDANEVGYVRGTSVYDRSGALVGTVRAATATGWVTGVTDAHRAGAALILLLANRQP